MSRVDTALRLARRYADGGRASGWSRTALSPEDEVRFQKEFRATPFFQEFVRRYKEEPDLDGDYDYRLWWQDGMEATRHRDGTLHGPSKTKDGRWLKSPDHPTAWKEDYMQKYGTDPDEDTAGYAEGGEVEDRPPPPPETEEDDPFERAAERTRRSVRNARHESDYLGTFAKEFAKSARSMPEKAIQSIDESFAGHYVPEGAAFQNDAGEYLDKDMNVLPVTRKPTVLPATKNPVTGEVEAAMPGVLDILTTPGGTSGRVASLTAGARLPRRRIPMTKEEEEALTVRNEPKEMPTEAELARSLDELAESSRNYDPRPEDIDPLARVAEGQPNKLEDMIADVNAGDMSVDDYVRHLIRYTGVHPWNIADELDDLAKGHPEFVSDVIRSLPGQVKPQVLRALEELDVKRGSFDTPHGSKIDESADDEVARLQAKELEKDSASGNWYDDIKPPDPIEEARIQKELERLAAEVTNDGGTQALSNLVRRMEGIEGREVSLPENPGEIPLDQAIGGLRQSIDNLRRRSQPPSFAPPPAPTKADLEVEGIWRKYLGELGYADRSYLSHGAAKIMHDKIVPFYGGSAQRFVDEYLNGLFRPQSVNITGGFTREGRSSLHIGGPVFIKDHGMANIDRSIWMTPDGGYAYHGYFELPTTARGGDFGKGLLRNQIDLYNHLGLSYVKLNANVSTGSYAWARYGFLPTTREEWRLLVKRVSDKMSDHPDFDKMPDAVRADFQEIMKIPDPRAIWLLVDHPAMSPYRRNGEDGAPFVTWANTLMKHQSWDGKLDLKDPEVMARFNSYVSRKKK